MTARTLLALLLTIVADTASGSASELSAGTTLRAAYLASNPAQAVRDPATGEIRGASADLARELARREGLKTDFIPLPNPVAVIEAVARGDADIGFVAYAPERVGAVSFSQVYMLVQQTFIVPEASPLRSVSDIDAPGLRIAGGRGDSVTLYLKRNLRQATLVETDNSPADTKQKFGAGAIDAFGANRQRLTTLLKEMPGYRLLPDNLFGVPQTIIVAKDRSKALAVVDRFIDDVRGSGFLQSAVTRSGIIGIEVAPPGFTLTR